MTAINFDQPSRGAVSSLTEPALAVRNTGVGIQVTRKCSRKKPFFSLSKAAKERSQLKTGHYVNSVWFCDDCFKKPEDYGKAS